MANDTTYPLYSIFAFLGFFISLIPLRWHLQAWNAGTCAFMIWTAIACLVNFVNSLVWNDSVRNVAPIWCDISSKLILGAGIGFPASTLCISRRLYKITSITTVSVSQRDKRRSALIDILIAVGIPTLVMILHVIVQPHRFDILEGIGCYPAVYNTLPAYFLYLCWPVFLGCVSFVFSCLTLRSFWLRRAQFEQLMRSNSSMSPSRYLRLMSLALIDIMFTVPLGIYVIYIGNKGVTLSPWISWSDTHFDFGRVIQVPGVVWRSDSSFRTSVELTRWLPVACAVLFFALFGFALEAQKQYSATFWWIANRFGYRKPALSASLKGSPHGWKKAPISPSPHGSLPLYTSNLPSSKKAQAFSIPISDDTELNTYSYDVEKSTGLRSPSPTFTAPPEYHYSGHNDITFIGLSPSSPRSCTLSLDDHTDTHTLRTEDSRPHIYVSESFHESSLAFPRSPSPAPFADMVATSPHDPFMPISHARSLEAIRVTVYTHSESTDAL